MTEKLQEVETHLFNRMMRNSIKGFLKGAVLGIAVGAAIGALVFGMNIIPADIIPRALLSFTGESIALAGAMIGASLCLLPAGRIGQIAGVQSTRDARRYLLGHEAGRRDALISAKEDPLRDVAVPAVEETHSPVRSLSYRDRIVEGSVSSSLTTVDRS